jgi:hypothetical protein
VTVNDVKWALPRKDLQTDDMLNETSKRVKIVPVLPAQEALPFPESEGDWADAPSGGEQDEEE